MRQAQVLVYESDGKLANLLGELCRERGWRLRELRHSDAVLNVLPEGAGALVLKVGRDLYEEMALLEQVRWAYLETAVVVVGDIDHPELAALAWDLGAAFVLLPPFSRDQLPEVVEGLMGAEEAAGG
jgi:DNA-binding NtrC family response regulator